MKRIISFWHFAAPWEKEKNPHSLISPWEINGWNAGGGKKPQIDPCCFNQGNVSAHICPCPFTLYLSGEHRAPHCFLRFNTGFTPDWLLTLQRSFTQQREGSSVAVSSLFCSWAFAMISEKRYWGVLLWQRRMELRWIVALCQGLSLRVSRVCLLRVNHAYQLTVSL